MKLSSVLLVALFCCINRTFTLIKEKKEENRELTQAIVDISRVFFINENIPFDIIVFGHDIGKTACIVDCILQKQQESSPTRVMRIDNPVNWTSTTAFVKTELGAKRSRREIFQSAIVICSTLFDLRSFASSFKVVNSFPKPLKFLVYTPGATHTDVRGLFSRLMDDAEGSIAQFEYFLIDTHDDDDTTLFLETFEWFTDHACDTAQLTTVNRFDKKSMRWQRQWESGGDKKFRDFHGCPLAYVRNDEESPWFYYSHANEERGLFVDMLESMAQVANFSTHYTNASTDAGAHVSFTPGILMKFFTEYTFISKTFLAEAISFVVTPGDLYTPYEKLLMPFDNLTWTLLLCTFAAAFVVICFVNLLPQRIKDVVYGQSVKMPAFNVVSTFFGIGQVTLPGANFPRFLLMIFILFCLVIRTAYQGVMFELLTSSPRRAPIDSIEEIRGGNFTIVVAEHQDIFLRLTPDFDMLREGFRVETLSGETFYDIYESQIDNASAKLAFLIPEKFIFTPGLRRKVDEIRIGDIVYSFHIGILLNRNHFLFGTMERLIERLIPAGIPQQLFAFHRSSARFRETFVENSNDPTVLALTDLSFGFIIWLLACAISTAGFVIEFMPRVARAVKRILREYFALLLILLFLWRKHFY